MAARTFMQNAIALLHTIVIYLWIIASTIFFGITAILFSFFSKNGDSVHHVARVWGRGILWVSAIRVKVHGAENIQERSAVYMSNHQSNFDIPVYFGGLPVQFRWVAKAELFKIPIFGQGMRGAGYISIDRSDTRSAIKSLNRAAQNIREGTSVLFFPEGTRSKDGNLRSFKKGGFIMAVEAGVPIIPMAVMGTFQVMPKGGKLIRRHPVQIVVCPPINAGDYTRKQLDQLMTDVKEAIGKALSQGQGETSRA